jgi:hypothetical protein
MSLKLGAAHPVHPPDRMAQEVLELFKELGIAQQNSVLDLLKRMHTAAG